MRDFRISRRAACAGLTGAMLTSPSAISAKIAHRPRPNLLFILADDLGYADLSSFGSRHIRTPALDRLAAQGAMLTDAYANSPVCSPTRLALATGRYNRFFPTGLVEPFSPGDWGETAIPEGYDTYMRLLQQAGYRTSLIGKWHLGPTEKGSPLNFGFDHFFGFLGGGLDYFTHEYLDKEALMEGADIIERDGYMTTLLADEAITELRRAEGTATPFCMNLHFNAPHWPWEGPEDASGATEGIHNTGGSLQIYAQMVESLDRNIGRVLTELDNLGLANDTLAIFTSDNGGERFSEVWPFRGTKGYLLEGGIRVPTIVRWPGQIPAGVTSDQIALTMDFFPTMLEAANVAYDASAVDGISLLGPISSGRSVDRTVFWGFQGHRQAAARSRNWKYFRIEENEFLYDLSADTHERANYMDKHPEIFEKLREAWQQWDASMADGSEIAGFCADPAGQALELPRGEGTNCKVYPRPAD